MLPSPSINPTQNFFIYSISLLFNFSIDLSCNDVSNDALANITPVNPPIVNSATTNYK